MNKVLKIGDVDLFTIRYDQQGTIVSIQFDETSNVIQRLWCLKMLGDGKTLENISSQITQKGVKNEVLDLPDDLSFEVFWNTYECKVGKKDRVKRKWEAMEAGERVKALQYIKKYRYYLAQHPHIQQIYPETYLNRAEWNN